MALLFSVDHHIATITINRPAVMNAMDDQTYEELSQAWTTVRDDPDIWVAVVTGAGDKSFTAGHDLKEIRPQSDDDAWEFFQSQSQPLLNRGLEVWKPVIAAVNGYCLGGGMTLLFATDIRVASSHATFGLSEVKRSLLPGNGGTQRALRQIPYAVAMELLLVGDPISASRAYEIGLINRVVPHEELMSTSYEYAERLTQNGPLALRAIKELAVRSLGMNFNDGVRLEQAFIYRLERTADAHEGPSAFGAHRPPVFEGR
jgi:E-phenylitaconyl-CoA hydratase